jgi:hypothetical protein
MRSFFSLAAITVATIAGTFVATTRADACAGLIGSNGAVNLGRTTTLAAYHNGEEHYVTSFEFSGTGGGEFGTLIPLPGVPSNVEKGGSWTLQRLNLETNKQEALRAVPAATSAGSADLAEVLIEKRIDALDITVLKGGGPAVAQWAEDHGFRLSPDAPEVLEFYAERSPIFLAAVFNGDAAAERGQQAGDGTPVHLTIPTDNPWVPLRILGLGKQPKDLVQADVYLLTDERPRILPGERKGLQITHNQAATKFLLDDLRSDENSAWVPEKAWLTKLSIDSRAADMTYDLAVDADGDDRPSAVAAGLASPSEAAAIANLEGDSDALPRGVLVAFGIAATVLAIVVAIGATNVSRRVQK